MKSGFILFSLLLTGLAQASCVENVAQSFERLENKVTELSVWTDHQFDSGTYIQSLKTRWGLNTHIQGVIRIPGTTSFALTGGDIYFKKGSLFIVDFASQEGKELLEKNFQGKATDSAPAKDRFILNMETGSRKFWHAGGNGILDRILAIPVEDNKITLSSRIVFYDLTDPEQPLKIPVEIDRTDSTTGSVLLFRDKDQKIVVGASVNGKIEFFRSKTKEIRDGFETETVKIDTQANGQGTHIIQQCDGKQFIIDFNNTSPLPPIIWGKDYVRLFSFDYEAGKVDLISTKHFKTNKFCNFKAAGSHFVTESGKLALYGTHFYRHGGGKRFKMCQFSEE